MLESYPDVADEHETVLQLLAGKSIARFGDGELKIIAGGGYSREPGSTALRMELHHTLVASHPDCLVGVWPLRGRRGPKFESLMRYESRFCAILEPHTRYVSSMITRPDCAPWIHNVEYAQMVEGLWRGKRAAVVCEHKGSMHRLVRLRALKAFHVECPHREAHAEIDRIEAQVLALAPDIAILSAGPTATCLANRLAGRGIQAIDFGSAGRWMGRLLE